LADSLAATEAEADSVVHPEVSADSSGGAVQIGEAPRRKPIAEPRGSRGRSG
jgi:hypothetical protein